MVLTLYTYVRLIAARDELSEDLSTTRLQLDAAKPVKQEATESSPVTTGLWLRF